MIHGQSVKKILILSANPLGTDRLRLDQEVREIREAIQKSRNRENIDLVIATAVRTKDIQQEILYNRPQIVHFCGHGAGNQGLIFEDINGRAKPVTTEALATLFGLCANYVECVVLNACYSISQAEGIANRIKYVAAMRQELGDKAAIEYSRGFYFAIASGEAYDIAHEYGRSAIQIEGLGEEMTPIIKKKDLD
ncbi:CHAT domain-containing protein [Leptolyngbya sp. O-77]|uniref:CHAT domain-containing protein n=1 Tax=Leptolyngbya sp. O-77 TaxID=1080068 RepID=UPI00074D3955|nr:CHAT domain-containing protein [Leptolyngbya sp. O-77]BAU42032.1 CHAT domain protein [Leptolyngbya sp. O-77]